MNDERARDVEELGAGQLVIALEGTFDVPAARRVEAFLDRVRGDREVRLDFTHVREFHDLGVAVLAQALQETRGARVRLQGLRRHQARLLRYLGVEPDGADATPGEVG